MAMKVNSPLDPVRKATGWPIVLVANWTLIVCGYIQIIRDLASGQPPFFVPIVVDMYEWTVNLIGRFT